MNGFSIKIPIDAQKNRKKDIKSIICVNIDENIIRDIQTTFIFIDWFL